MSRACARLVFQYRGVRGYVFEPLEPSRRPLNAEGALVVWPFPLVGRQADCLPSPRSEGQSNFTSVSSVPCA
eukprot:8007974-Lingulodinium_polyedra.AAC.1